MRIEVAVDARDGVGEGPFWDEPGQALWWVDIPGKAVQRWVPAHRRAASAGRCPTFPWPRSCCGRRAAPWWRCAMGSTSWTRESGGLQLFCRPDADRPDNRSNEAKCGPVRRLLARHHGQQSSSRRLAARDDRQYRRALPGASPTAASPARSTGVGLSNTLAWTDDGRTLLFADTLTGVISAFAVRDDGGLGARRVFSDEKLPGFCDGSTIDAEGYLWNARFAGSCLIRFAPGRPGRPHDRTAGHQPDLLLLRRPGPADALRHLGPLRPEPRAARPQPRRGCGARPEHRRFRAAVRAVRRLRGTLRSRPEGPTTPRASRGEAGR